MKHLDLLGPPVIVLCVLVTRTTGGEEHLRDYAPPRWNKLPGGLRFGLKTLLFTVDTEIPTALYILSQCTALDVLV